MAALLDDAKVTLTLEGKGNPGVSFKDVWPRVASVAPGGLAHAAGVRAGHVCLTVGDDAAGSFSDARDALAGRGRPLSLTFATRRARPLADMSMALSGSAEPERRLLSLLAVEQEDPLVSHEDFAWETP